MKEWIFVIFQGSAGKSQRLEVWACPARPFVSSFLTWDGKPWRVVRRTGHQVSTWPQLSEIQASFTHLINKETFKNNISKSIKSTCPHKNLHTNILSIIHSSEKVKTIQCPSSGGEIPCDISVQWNITSHQWNEVLTHAMSWMHFRNIIPVRKNQIQTAFPYITPFV